MIWMLLVACGQAEAEEVAAVMMATGTAQVESHGTRSPASVGLELHRDDTLVTGPDGTIIVHLRNDHVVRIDSDLELQVSDLVLLDAPQSTIEPGKQLATLLYPEEQAELAPLVSTARERVAGWHSRLTAADSHLGIEEKEASDEVDEEAPSKGTSRGFRDASGKADAAAEPEAEIAPSPRPRPAPPPPRKVPTQPLPGVGSAGPGAGDSAPPAPPLPPQNGFGIRGDDAPPRDEAPVMRGSNDLDDIESWFGTDGPYETCLTEWAPTLGVPMEKIEIVLRVENGKITRAFGKGGLQLPECARDALLGIAISGSESEYRFVVELR